MTFAAESFGLSLRRSCQLVNLWLSSYRYKPRLANDEALRTRMRELAEQRRRFGCPRLHVMLKREGLVVNRKRTERIYREEKLSLRLKKRKRRPAAARITLPLPERPNQRWSMDFVHDSLWSGRKFRALTIVDDYTRESPAIEVDTSIGGRRICRVLDRLAETRGLPEVIVMDNGPEFIGKALDQWAYEKGVKLHFIQPGKPTQNAYIESFNGKFRDECLNDNWFTTLQQAKEIIEAWRKDYNEERPHSSLGGISPSEFLKKIEVTNTERLQLAL